MTSGKACARAFFLGALMALAMPPAGLFPVLLLCVPGFVALARDAPTKRAAFLTGWAFGAGYFIAGFYWISAALFVDIGQWMWALPFSAVVGPGLLGLYYGLIPLAARPFRDNRTVHALACVTAWAAVEWLRGHLFTGFPWNLPAYAWMHVPPVMQVAAAAGAYGLTLLTLLWAALPALGKKARIAAAASFFIVLAAGTARLALHPPQDTGQVVRIVQANIPQSLKWDSAEEWRNLEKHARLSAAGTPAAFVVWPETALAADPAQFPDIARYVAENMPRGAYAILGSLRMDRGEYFNSVSLLDDAGRAVDVYDKHHLVPFGEFIPFRKTLNLTPVAAAISGTGDFRSGPGPRTLEAPGLPAFSPLVCYEAIFPGASADRNNRPAWLVNVTNDGWYGRTAGPYQHFEITRLRAVEEGLPLARAANTGISGMTDALGRVAARLPLGAEGVLDAPLPAALPPTPYARFGDWIFLGMLALLSGIVAVVRRHADK